MQETGSKCNCALHCTQKRYSSYQLAISPRHWCPYRMKVSTGCHKKGMLSVSLKHHLTMHVGYHMKSLIIVIFCWDLNDKVCKHFSLPRDLWIKMLIFNVSGSSFTFILTGCGLVFRTTIRIYLSSKPSELSIPLQTTVFFTNIPAEIGVVELHHLLYRHPIITFRSSWIMWIVSSLIMESFQFKIHFWKTTNRYAFLKKYSNPGYKCFLK